MIRNCNPFFTKKCLKLCDRNKKYDIVIMNYKIKRELYLTSSVMRKKNMTINEINRLLSELFDWYNSYDFNNVSEEEKNN